MKEEKSGRQTGKSREEGLGKKEKNTAEEGCKKNTGVKEIKTKRYLAKREGRGTLTKEYRQKKGVTEVRWGFFHAAKEIEKNLLECNNLLNLKLDFHLV